jgi:hypothetical protein
MAPGGGAPLLDQLALVPDGKAHVGPRQRVAAHRLDAVRQLGGVGLQELAARRGGEEQLFHLHRGAGAARGGRSSPLRASSKKALAASAVRDSRAIPTPSDGGQRLAAKAHGGHGFQVVQAGDLAGGVAAQRHGQLVGAMPQPSSSTAIRRTPPASRRTVICVAPGVQRVVHQLAHHRGRALHHLAGGNLADEFVGQVADRARAGGRRVRARDSEVGGVHGGILGGAGRWG